MAEAQLTAEAAADFANVSARTPAGYATAAYDNFSPPPLARSQSGYATSAYKVPYDLVRCPLPACKARLLLC